MLLSQKMTEFFFSNIKFEDKIIFFLVSAPSQIFFSIKVDQPVTVNKEKMRKSHISGLVKSNIELPLNKTNSKQLGGNGY